MPSSPAGPGSARGCAITPTRTLFLGGIKAAAGDDGTFRGYLSVFNVTDGVGHVVEPGAFKGSLVAAERERKDRGTPYPFPVRSEEHTAAPPPRH